MTASDAATPATASPPSAAEASARGARATGAAPKAPSGALPPPAEPTRDERWLRPLLIGAPLAAASLGLVGIPLGLITSVPQAIVALVLPMLILAALALGDRPGGRTVAAIGLDVEAVLAAAVSPLGIAFALVLPLIAVGLVQPILRGRQLAMVFVASAITAIGAVAVALFVGPLSGQLPVGASVLTVISFAAVTTFALALDWRATRRLLTTIAANEAEIVRRDRAESRLRETTEILDAIVRSSPVPTQAFDLERRIQIWNPAAERVFGWTTAEMIGHEMPPDMTPPEEREEGVARIRRTFAGEPTIGDRVRRLTKDGQERWIDIYAAAMFDPDGRPMGIAGQLVDVTERVRLEAQLLQAQKMGAVGLLASGIAHDFNNTLTAARGYAELIRSSSDPTAVADADAILEAVERGQQLTRELLDFARKDEAQATVVDLRQVIGGIEPLIRRLIGGTVAVELRLPPEPVFVRIVVGQLEQALVNLALNARDAMPDGGVVTIALVQVPGEAEADIEVIDTGVGIPDTLIDTVFEPFVTTKPPGKGTGLGLAMVSGFAENASGRLTVRSEVGKGTTFSIRLPLAEAPPTEMPAVPIGAN